MIDLGRAAALALAVVFAWAGAAKLAARDTTASSFRSLRLPRPRLLAAAVPAVELVVAAGLLVAPAIAATAALAMLIAFSVVLVRALRLGLDVTCACFGAAAADPVSVQHVVRNGLLACAAVAAFASDGGLWPGIPALVAVTLAGAIGRVALALADLRRHGPLWPTTPGADMKPDAKSAPT